MDGKRLRIGLRDGFGRCRLSVIYLPASFLRRNRLLSIGRVEDARRAFAEAKAAAEDEGKKEEERVRKDMDATGRPSEE